MNNQRPASNRRKEKRPDFKVGDLVKIGHNVSFLTAKDGLGMVGLITSFNQTGYPKGISGRSRDDKMYTVVAAGKSVKLFEDEMELLC